MQSENNGLEMLSKPVIGDSNGKFKCPITFGSHNISEGKNEDRGSMFLSHKAEGCPQLASFSVFDGHNGSVAASACSQHFNRNVATRVHKFRSCTSPPSIKLPQEMQNDAIFCESFRLSCIEMDRNVQFSHKSGCTLNSLFLEWNQEDGSVRAYCANVGDSKCALYTPFKIPDGTTTADSTHDIPLALIKSTQTHAFAMSVDHKLDLPRERKRIKDRLPLEWRPLPSDVIRGTIKAKVEGDARDIIIAGCPSSQTTGLATIFISNLIAELNRPESLSDINVKDILYKTSDHAQMMSALDLTSKYSNREEGAYTLVHSASFVDFRRIGKFVGPEAIFSRYNLSINMTRSIGDKYAARCVIPIPDVSCITIPPHQFARFILCSDGVWDVMEIEEIKNMAFSSPRSEEISLMIAEEARLRRIKKRIRMDDISVITVDVNYHLFHAPFGTNCGCTLS